MKPLEWLLLTREPMRPEAEAERLLRQLQSCRRTKHRHWVLKTDCILEYPVHRSRERISWPVATNAVIPWRLHLMVVLGTVPGMLLPTLRRTGSGVEILWEGSARLAPTAQSMGCTRSLNRVGAVEE